MDLVCRECNRPLSGIDMSAAGPLALKFAGSLVCDDCAGDPEEPETSVAARREGSDIPFSLASSFGELADEFAPTAIELAEGWSTERFPLLTLFGRAGRVPDRLAASAAVARLELGSVNWFSAGDQIAREEAIAKKNSTSAMVLADVDQASLLRQATSEVFTVLTHRQQRDLPLLVTSSISGRELAEAPVGPILIRRLRSRGKAVHVADKAPRGGA